MPLLRTNRRLTTAISLLVAGSGLVAFVCTATSSGFRGGGGLRAVTGGGATLALTLGVALGATLAVTSGATLDAMGDVHDAVVEGVTLACGATASLRPRKSEPTTTPAPSNASIKIAKPP